MRLGDLVAGRFRLEDVAGTGGMGAVYRATDHESGHPVAIKVLRADSVEHVDRFAREIRVLAQLRHPGIVRYIADGTMAGELWLAMEWLAGESVSQRMRRGITAPDAIALIRRVAEALGAAHDKGVVHRDVKPSNLWLPANDLEQVKVLDFGVARISAGDKFSTRTGIMIGTPGYMAPEQARGDRDVGPRADVFALGCVLFEALTGTPPFSGEHMMAVLAKILLDEAPRLGELRPELPRDLDNLLARCLAKRPEERPADGGELASLLGNLGTLDTLVDRPSRQRPSLTRNERKILCVVLIGGGEDAFDTVAEAVMSIAPTTSTETGGGDTQVLAALRDSATAHGGSLERLVDGSHVVTVTGGGTAGDQAAQAARCALALKVIAPTAPIALATGRAVMAGRWPVGEAIDRAAKLLGAAGVGVRIDDVTAGLLDARFEIGGDGAGLYVLAEHDAFASTRTLLGKPTPCVGRDRELGVLVGLYDECVAEPLARAVLVTGPAGIGKSRVRHELGHRIDERGEPFEIWLGRGDPLRAGSPYGILAPALRRAAGIQDGEPLDVRRHKLRARVMRNASTELARTTMFLGELIGTPFELNDDYGIDVHDDLRAARADPLLMAEQIRRAFEHFVGIETAAQPLAIVLEDLHWGDVPSVKLVDAALRALPDRPLFVMALARPEVHELFPRLWAERGLQELRLDELTKKGSERLVRGVLGEATSDTLVARIVEQAGGNAFYLEELIRAAAEGKGDAMPETVLAVVQSRLERLEADARHVLRAASVFGGRFWRGGVVELVGGTGTNEWLDELVQRELIARGGTSRFPGQEELRFRHGLVREAAYAMLTDADKKLGHQLAGAWLARAGESDPMVLGEHAEQAGDEARASELYRAGAEHALAACDFAGASARAEQAFGCGARGENRGLLRLVQAEARRWLGEFEQAARCGLDAMTLLAPGSAPWFAAANEAAESKGKIDDVAALEHLGQALHNTPASDRHALGPRMTAIANLAFQLFSHASNSLALALLDDVEEAAQGVTEPGILARIFQARSSRSMFTGDVGAYLDSEQAAAAAFERAGDLRYACVQRGNVGYACLEIGAYAEAERALRDALDQATRLGLANVAATVKHNLGRALMMRGALDEALRIETEAFELFAAQGDRRLAGAARAYRAAILAAKGELGAAEGELLGALVGAQLPMQSVIHGNLARILVRAGRAAEALDHARRGHAILEQLGAIEEGEASVRLALAEALAATGDAAGARAAFAVARRRLLDRAARISDAGHRQRVRSQVPEHVATLAGDA